VDVSYLASYLHYYATTMSTQSNNARSQQTISRFFSTPSKPCLSQFSRSENALGSGDASDIANETNGTTLEGSSVRYQPPKTNHFGNVNGNVANRLASIKVDRLKNFVNIRAANGKVRDTDDAADDAERTSKRRKIAGNVSSAEILEARRRVSMIGIRRGESAVEDSAAVDIEDKASIGEDADEQESSPLSDLRGRFGAESEAPLSEGYACVKGKAKIAKPKKLTAMVQQYIDIKRQHMDAIIAFEVGYKFYFYGEDARVCLQYN
jgi:hypothetical protein